MSKPKPWHQVARLRQDLLSDTFSTAFTANLYLVITNEGPEIYRDPAQFFGMTYATEAVKDLAKDVLRRLAGSTDRAVHQLEQTYGGGKTHTEILLRHLVRDPAALPSDSQALREILVRAGMEMDALPRARVAALPFDYLDSAKGIEVHDPDGRVASFRLPWNAIAWQIAGDRGLETIGGSRESERTDAPYTKVLTDLLRLPEAEGMGTLILLDEVLMWARDFVGMDDDRLERLRGFFQRLSEAVKAVDHCCLVVSLLANQTDMMDARGQAIMEQLYAALRRQGEVGITPIAKEDIAEVLRRRFFEPESIRDREAFRPSVRYALQGIAALDDQTGRRMPDETKRFLDSFPFHPDLIDVLYQKWTGLAAFQQARGVLQTFALALRDAEGWDRSPLVGVNVFLTAPEDAGRESLSLAAQDLTNIARQQAVDDINPDWPKIIEGELSRAREIQEDFPDLRSGREVEQAVFAIFLHSVPQPSEKARTRELMALLGHSAPDKIVLARTLERLARTSWFLDEATMQDVQAAVGGDRRLPETWRYGFQHNLRAMHHFARERVEKPSVETELLNAIGRVDGLTRGAKLAGATPHLLPDSPHDVGDDGVFRYVVLGPKAASESGRPSAEAIRYLEEHNGPDYPRKYRNAILVAAPSRDGLINARERVRDVIAWRSVKEELKQQDRNFEENAPQRAAKLEQEMREAEAAVPTAIRAAYCIAVTRDMAGDVQAFKVNSMVPGSSLFQIIKADSRSRIQETAVSAEALMPGSQYDLWETGEHAHLVADLVGEFARNPRLPKLLRRDAIYQTLAQGCESGALVFRLKRPGDPERTFWQQDVALMPGVLEDARLEVVLPDRVTLTSLAPELLKCPEPQEMPRLPGLWDGDEITFDQVVKYFSGGREVMKPEVLSGQVQEVPFQIPAATEAALRVAVSEAVKDGYVWLEAESAAIYRKTVAPETITREARLVKPLPTLATTDILPEVVPDAWEGEATSFQALSSALSARAGKPLPPSYVRDVVNQAYYAGLVLLNTPLPMDEVALNSVLVKVSSAGGAGVNGDGHPETISGLCAQATLRASEIQNLAEVVGQITQIAADNNLALTFRLALELHGDGPPVDAVNAINDLLEQVADGLRLQ